MTLSAHQEEIQKVRNHIRYQDELLEQLELMEKLENIIIQIKTIINRQEYAASILRELLKLNEVQKVQNQMRLSSGGAATGGPGNPSSNFAGPEKSIAEQIDYDD